MAFSARRVDYFYATATGEAGEAFQLLSHLADLGVNFMALTLVPVGPDTVQLTMFPKDPQTLLSVARSAGLAINGPHPAVLVQGDDEIGALAHIHSRLQKAGVDVFASSAVTDGKGLYGCVLYLRTEHADKAAKALQG
jgi:hypothetical protein